MKCDELKAYKADVTIPVYGTIADAEVYLKDKADEAIAELKDKCEMHDFFWEGCWLSDERKNQRNFRQPNKEQR